MTVDLEAIFELESTLGVVTVEPKKEEETRKEMEVSLQSEEQPWGPLAPQVHRVPA